MKTNFKNANGDLSRYALACGYVQKREVSPGIEVSLWREHGVYHVRAHDFENGRRVFWRSGKLTECRKIYRKGIPA